MKRLLTQTIPLLALGVCLHADPVAIVDFYENAYIGPRDDVYWKSSWDYFSLRSRTTLGTLARYSDIIGVGQISNREENHFTITVDHALVGCTNGAVIVIYERPPDGGEESVKDDITPYISTNDSRIVFAAYTNVYAGTARMYWSSPEIPLPAEETLPHYEMIYYNRSWWYPERDDGVLFTQFTNIIQAVRFERNWTNFFYLCRDGANSTSNRVKEDSFWDLFELVRFATNERAQLILDDPLVIPLLKTIPFLENWRPTELDP